jgi:hypothetical protein
MPSKSESGVGKVVRLAEKMGKDLIEFKNTWADKFNEMSQSVSDLTTRFKAIVTATGQQLSVINANIGVHMEAIEQLDIYNQVNARAILECYGRFSQIDVILQNMESILRTQFEYGDSVTRFSQSDLEAIKKDARQCYEDTMQNCFELVREERAQKLKEYRAEQEKARQEEEAKRAEDELKDSEAKKLVSEPGGDGASIPEGAEVFGG